MAVLASVVANANRAKGKKAVPKDFMPEWDRGERQSWQSMLAAVKQFNRALGGDDLTKGDADDGAGPR